MKPPISVLRSGLTDPRSSRPPIATTKSIADLCGALNRCNAKLPIEAGSERHDDDAVANDRIAHLSVALADARGPSLCSVRAFQQQQTGLVVDSVDLADSRRAIGTHFADEFLANIDREEFRCAHCLRRLAGTVLARNAGCNIDGRAEKRFGAVKVRRLTAEGERRCESRGQRQRQNSHGSASFFLERRLAQLTV